MVKMVKLIKNGQNCQNEKYGQNDQKWSIHQMNKTFLNYYHCQKLIKNFSIAESKPVPIINNGCVQLKLKIELSLCFLSLFILRLQ